SSNDENKYDFLQFARHLDYIIRFDGRSEESFHSINWDIKYRNSKHTVKEILEKSRIINKEIEKEEIVIDLEQAIIQSNHKELNINIEENEYSDFNIQESDIELDIEDEEIYKEFQRTNKKNQNLNI
ncbi:17502_t:CDS:2, partial [Cetraspora pellucida]